ncbi:MAG: hypothetical protein JO025_07275 [Verrucomicrobia bacterium]|nr:hypothetical protein [Verrucomicrobiota bacterium]
MMDANAFLKRTLVVVAVTVLSMGAYAHGGGGKGTGGSSGGGSASSGSSGSGGHSASSTSSGHSATASSHAVTASANSASASKSSYHPHDPPNVSQSTMGNPAVHGRIVRIFQQVPVTGYTTQYREMNNEEYRRKHNRLFLGFIRY